MAEASAALIALNESVRMLGIEFQELHASRSAEAGKSEDEPVEVEPEYGLAIERRDEVATEFRLRLRIEIKTIVGDIAAEAAVYYDAQDYDGELTDEVLLEYANQVGIMALLPYLRQAVSDLTQRVFGTPLLMPIMKRGELFFDADDVVMGA